MKALAIPLLFLSLGAVAADVSDQDVGAVRAYTRKVAIDLEACRQTFKVFVLPMTLSAQGTCRVDVPVRDSVPATVQTTANAEIRDMQGDTELRRLTFHGDGRAYALTYYDAKGIANWAAAEKAFKELLAQKFPAGTYETLITKVVLGN